VPSASSSLLKKLIWATFCKTLRPDIDVGARTAQRAVPTEGSVRRQHKPVAVPGLREQNHRNHEHSEENAFAWKNPCPSRLSDFGL